MANQIKTWELISKSKVANGQDIISTLLKNRKIKTEKQKDLFFKPTNPIDISIETLGIQKTEVEKAIKRIKKAKETGELVIVYGDYDADGITGTATMWETLHAIGINVLPHIPERFSEGYGLNLDSVKKLKKDQPSLGLIITVDHGIVAGEKVKKVKELGIDMIISDHHQAGSVIPKPLALIYTTQVGGSAVSWFLAHEFAKSFGIKSFDVESCLELAAIGTIADQLPLIGVNRSIVKFGLDYLNKTKRLGLNAMIEEAKIKKGEIGTYEVGFLIAPRINSMGRLKHGLESLRLLCTKDNLKALSIANNISTTNFERQKIVEQVILHARKSYGELSEKSVIVLADESYHEGVIGLAAAKLVEEFYRPAIVLSKKGEISKASARSINGFNIIEAIRKLEKLYIEGGGHPMAAGFSINTENILEFDKKINEIAKLELTPEILSRKLKIDLETDFSNLTMSLYKDLEKFEPNGLGNFEPTFLTEGVEVVSSSIVGKDFKHLKLKLRQGGTVFDAIAFGFGDLKEKLNGNIKIKLVYGLDLNVWNGNVSLQLKVRDIKID